MSLLAVGVLVASILLTYVIGTAAISTRAREADARHLVQRLDGLVSTLKDAETGQRGYLLTGDDAYLEPYRHAVSAVRAEEKALLARSFAGDLPRDAVEKVFADSRDKLAELQETIRLRRDSGLDAALALVSTGNGKGIMDRIRSGITRMTEPLRLSIRREARRSDVFFTLRTVTFIVTGLLNLGVLLWAFRRLGFEIEERRREKELLRTTLSSIGDGVIVTDAEGRVSLLNAEAERLTGWDEAQGRGRELASIFRIVNEESRVSVENPVDKVLRLGTVVGLANHTILIGRDGRETPIDDSAAPIREQGGPLFGVVLVFRDFTEQRKSQAALANHARMLDSVFDAVFVRDPQDRIVRWNRAAADLYGWTAEEAVGRVPHELLKTGFPKPLPEILADLAREGRWQGELVHTRKDGRRIAVLSRWILERDAQGRTASILETCTDITERKRAQDEILRLNASLEERVVRRTRQLQETVQELETFSYSVAHDLRGPLRAMHRSTEVLLQEESSKLTDEGKDFLRRIGEGAHRMDRLIQDLLAYSRITRAELKPVPIEPQTILVDLLAQLSADIEERRAEVRVDDPIPPVLADPILLTQVLNNLLSNALKFVPEGTPPRIRIHAEARNGMERIWVEDNGIGIDPRYKERLFRLFERLDSTYPGTGIGLAIVKRAVERMGGLVGVETGSDRGSRFWIEMPRVENGSGHQPP